MAKKDTNGFQRHYKGWTLVETAHNFYHAYRGTQRVAVGAIKHGDRVDLVHRFRRAVDGLECV